MSVGLKALPQLLAVTGVSLGTAPAGIRQKNRDDVTIISCHPGTVISAVFTQNRFLAAPVLVAKKHLGQSSPRALIINSGNANAGTGEQGIQDTLSCCAELAQHLQCAEYEILPFSTGVIGEPLPVGQIRKVIPECISDLSEENWPAAARSIMTTDTVAKGVCQQLNINGETVTITGIAKGAGMIHPNMATLLTFIATDAAIEKTVLDAILTYCVDRSFNRITVDGDTSTNDACVLMATGSRTGAKITQTGDENGKAFMSVLLKVFQELAQAVIRDAEGATKFITIEVVDGRDEEDCLQVAKSVALSPLVKTAFFASDPNWGRILAAIGYAPIAELDISKVSIALNDVMVLRNGTLASSYTEEQGQAVMQHEEITVRISLGQGQDQARIWTSDLSHDYVSINSEYRS
ncbi:MAG: bifunctional glutamate N-acetyltransferase/amino-acid acetyltransferase ArgJ [Gammaproteobacteria bacterium]|nr:MAG: bifunctional glutamate N-acetyltransferase/amino-acid acetyltransferase ArgJ [Gammaproteobacteria bacterium]